jgi:hypothetical protein
MAVLDVQLVEVRVLSRFEDGRRHVGRGNGLVRPGQGKRARIGDVRFSSAKRRRL